MRVSKRLGVLARLLLGGLAVAAPVHADTPSDTSPAVTALPGGGFQAVFQGSGTGILWRYGVGAGSYTGSTPVGLAADTSSSVN